MELTNAQWQVVAPLIPEPPRRPDGRGRPWRPAREIFGILWILRTGAPWRDLPARYPPYQTCHRRFQQWVRAGVFDAILHGLAGDLAERGDLDFSECFIDGTFDPKGAPIQKGGSGVGKTKRGKGTKIMAITDAHGLPIAIHISSAAPHEITLVESTLVARFADHAPERSSVIRPTTATRMMRPWPYWALR